MTQPSLDDILSGNATAAPVIQEEAPKVEPPVEEAPQTEERPEAEGHEDQSGNQKMVPHEALHAEKQKVKRYTEQVASFEETLKQRDAAWEQRFNQLIETFKPKAEQAPPPDWYADPDAAFEQRLGSKFAPIKQKFSTLETQILRLTAIQQHGADKVKAFEDYVTTAMQRQDPEMAALSAQMRASNDPMSVGLDWFEKRTFDPEKERERIREEERKRIEEELQQSQPARTQAPVMPSNFATARNMGSRAGPAWSGPPTLQDIFKR